MKTLMLNAIYFVLLTSIPSLYSYTNMTPAEVHTRLAEGDTLLLLDVREVSEYRAGHIAEPSGQLPLTPVNMPLNSNVLSTEYHRLPRNMDIVVYCRSGGRSATASSFLDSNGFTQIYNMTGGYSSWTHEYRENGYGDQTGKWVRSTDLLPVTITCSVNGDTSKIIIPPNVIPETDSTYFELHFASSHVTIPPNVPQSDLKGLFRITALDPFGLSLFIGDSLSVSDTVNISFFPEYVIGGTTPLVNHNMTVYVPGEEWRTVPYNYDGFIFYRKERVLRRWYNVEGFINTGITEFSFPKQPEKIHVFPNPFNSSVHIIAPPQAIIFIYNMRGRLIEQLKSPIWAPDHSVVSGIYLVNVLYAGQKFCQRVVYLK